MKLCLDTLQTEVSNINQPVTSQLGIDLNAKTKTPVI